MCDSILKIIGCSEDGRNEHEDEGTTEGGEDGRNEHEDEGTTDGGEDGRNEHEENKSVVSIGTDSDEDNIKGVGGVGGDCGAYSSTNEGRDHDELLSGNNADSTRTSRCGCRRRCRGRCCHWLVRFTLLGRSSDTSTSFTTALRHRKKTVGMIVGVGVVIFIAGIILASIQPRQQDSFSMTVVAVLAVGQPTYAALVWYASCALHSPSMICCSPDTPMVSCLEVCKEHQRAIGMCAVLFVILMSCGIYSLNAANNGQGVVGGTLEGRGGVPPDDFPVYLLMIALPGEWAPSVASVQTVL
jgi:hypothetical protein